jgi:hypothetical protein
MKYKIKGDVLNGLKSYLLNLIKHFPSRANTTEFLSKLYTEIQNRDVMIGEEFSEMVQVLEFKNSRVYSRIHGMDRL